ncbi:MAG: ribonuclease Y [Candidatus Spechtbacteria bacterium RIFCSPHIGHO2_02_FULL_43_15b]|uniref:Ribonuclease Y n=1 Tax=Candidatus Spechtbacteria bacterium RIFCSPHIGHO2_01_FULL_43_30 TaxID=1802158 RepID=A0A1G2H5W2_9BACT|nr:MAG: ribonuclease Y [Candidatus Spechtbacteria bacterium RIFCSPHIGHO2_01_FULL_43_30]OGZ59335.1 MAG: ribonuclease Y [Candidatus Spechtbacteria bacterium RIFCSPHIGHO2_02_FULL_43_15b]
MTVEVTTLIISLVSIGFGAVLGYFARQSIAKHQRGTAEEHVSKMLSEAKTESRDILIGARDKSVKILEDAKKEDQALKNGILEHEKRVFDKEALLEKKSHEAQQYTEDLARKAEQVRSAKREVDELRVKQLKELERVANISSKEAKEELLVKVEREFEIELHDRLKKLENHGKEVFDARARDILVTAMQRYASSQSQETTTTTIALSSDEIKGRIIGKEGRNIRTLERLCGVELIIDDTPESLMISGFDPIRRHIAKLALEKLMVDGRIQPARIEEYVSKAKEEISAKIKEAGEAAVYDAGIVGLDPKLVWLLGRLRFRTSYGQNVLMHSLEVCHLAGALAAETGCDIQIAKKGGLLHDIGKAVDHEVEGSHVEIGRNLLKKFGVSEDVIKAMQSHHEEYPYETPESIIVQTADALSAARPGARRDTVENYIRRLTELEAIADSFSGVEKSYAIQAGREVRVFVTPVSVDDAAAKMIARKIANRIQDELKYPGDIKVTVIRENRYVEYAR